MATYTRKNAWNNSGDFTNLDLLWYAKGVRKMMSRALNDPASWWFYAAIHGEYVNPATTWYKKNPARFPDWGFITPTPAVPTSPLPTSQVQSLYWNQCQHGSYYFLPWHRGYLMALEAQLRLDIVSLGGPSTWALPYWNYFGGTGGSQYKMPPAFGKATLPDGSANALYVKMRYGPDANSKIYIPTAAGEAAHPNDPNFGSGEVKQDCMQNTLFTGTNAVTPPPGFGGPQSGFAHNGSPHGNCERNPHDLVHVYSGGGISNTNYGLMSDPGTAALDPIFYLHHCNIDRMWAVWNLSKANPTTTAWLNGPTTRKFVMPGPGGNPWYYTPQQVGNLSKLNYTYSPMPVQPIGGGAPTALLAKRLTRLGMTAAAAKKVTAAKAQAEPKKTELLGASKGPLRIKGLVSETPVKLDTRVRSKATASFAKASTTSLPDKVFLKIENVRGEFDAAALSVYVNLPEKAKPGKSSEYLAGTIALFGLNRASAKDGQHAGEGLTFILGITRIIDELHLENAALDADSLRVRIVPSRPLPDDAKITVGRISVYRQAF
jgi:tyrosinase